MADLVRKFGYTVVREVPEHPVGSRRAIVAGLKLFGFKLDHFPNKVLTPSRQYIASLLNDVVVEMLTHPENAALTSLFVPCEMIHAAGYNPLCAELYSAFMNGCHVEKAFIDAAEAQGIAETFCSYHKVLLGSAYAGVLPKPAFIVNTSLICDANNLTFRALADYYHIDQFYVDVPPYDDAGSTAYVAEQLREMKTFLEDETHRPITEEMLQERIRISRQTIGDLKESMTLKGQRYLPGDTASELYEIYSTHMGLGTEKNAKYAAMLREDLLAAGPPRGIRILWVHTIPNWQEPIRQTFNFTDQASIIACDLNYDCLLEMDPEKPYESMARRLTENIFNGSGQKRIDRAREMAQKLNVDGVVVFCHWGCKQTAGLSAQIRDQLEEAGYPVLILNGDGCDESNSSDGQVSTRMNAFMELLRSRKKSA